ncbi:hypothetical protein BDV23DRAFT_162207 [Aspergillus alliaceus]|uniref:Uncharacterized protein n=1 Tax=Petromyces alliaceus TaxID=209559 RepID=A0A5N7BYL6_PETAA|nr:hypothetical protein BDV23DRAFT_162207 [Aspergillus alliaceus]
MASGTKFYTGIAALINPSKEFRQYVDISLNDIDEKNDVEVLTQSRSRLKFPASWERVYRQYESEYLPKIFSDDFRSLFDKDEVTKATEPQLCSCRDGHFTFSKTTVLSVFIIFDIRAQVVIQVERRDGTTKTTTIDECGRGMILITHGGCNLRFSGGGQIILANMTYQKG